MNFFLKTLQETLDKIKLFKILRKVNIHVSNYLLKLKDFSKAILVVKIAIFSSQNRL